MSGSLEIDWCGERLVLLAERAVWWPARSALLVADIHFGKAAAFRRRGLPLPEGDTAADLARLGRLVDLLGASDLVILGDWFHAPDGRSPAVLDALTQWLEQRPGLRRTLAPGNHDRRAGLPPASWGFVLWRESGRLGPFRLEHEPPAEDSGDPVLCGHVHPAIRIPDGRRTAFRAPCFWRRGKILVLPSFGSFTGGRVVHPRAGDAIYAVAGDSVMEVPESLWGGAGRR